jgi:hypothetical protein
MTLRSRVRALLARLRIRYRLYRYSRRITSAQQQLARRREGR